MFIDTHCHLIMPGFKYNINPYTTIKSSYKAGVSQMWVAGTNKNDNIKNLKLSEKYPNIVKTWLGFHPEEYQEFDLAWMEDLLKAQKAYNNMQKTRYKEKSGVKSNSQISISKLETSQKPKFPNAKLESKFSLPTYQPVVGVGEVGIDLNWHKKDSLTAQQQVFEEQIKLANKYSLPVAIHSRDAVDQTIEVMEKYRHTKFLWHCYNLDRRQTERLLSLFNNIYFGFNAIITYKSGAYIMESLKFIPIENLLFETDSPFLAPRPFKYSFNSPEGVIEVYKFVSKNLNIELFELTQKIKDNAARFLKNNG